MIGPKGYDDPVLTDVNDEPFPDVDYYDMMEWGLGLMVKVSYEALREEELEVLPEEEDWN